MLVSVSTLGKIKILGVLGGSMVARLKLKGIDGSAPPGVEPHTGKLTYLPRIENESLYCWRRSVLVNSTAKATVIASCYVVP